MAWNIKIEGNYFKATDTVGNRENSYPSADVRIAKGDKTATSFRFTYLNLDIPGMSNVPFVDILDELGGNWINQATFEVWARGNTGENIPSSSSPLITEDYLLEVAMGNVPGAKVIHKFGSITGLTTALTPITTSGTYQTPIALAALEIVSDSVNDVAAGSGARTVRIDCISDINGSWTEQTIDIVMNGTTAVALPNSVWRVFRMKVLTSGTYATQTSPSHNSTITLRGSGAGVTWAQIISEGTFGLGQSEIAVYSNPTGKTAYILSTHKVIEGTKSAKLLMFIRENADTLVAPFSPMQAKDYTRDIDGIIPYNPSVVIAKITGPGDIGFMGASTTGTTQVSISFSILLVDD